MYFTSQNQEPSFLPPPMMSRGGMMTLATLCHAVALAKDGHSAATPLLARTNGLIRDSVNGFVERVIVV